MPSVIALDAMGSDRRPKPEIEGAIQAARHYDVHVLLVGPEPALRAELARYPSAAALPIDVVHASEIIGMEDKAVQAVRAWRDSAGVKAGAVVATRLAASDYEQTSAHLARLARLRFSEDGGEPVASVPVPGGAVEILAGEALDLDAAERKRAAAREKLENEIARSEKMLSNEGFVSKAKPEVVQSERDKLARLRAELDAL